MKKIILINIAAILSLFLLASCQNEPVDPAIDLNPIIPVLPASFKADFDGQTYIASQIDATIAEGQISINAYKGAQLQSFSIAITGTTVGSYLANENIISYSAGTGQPLFVSVNPTNILQNTGQVTITSIDTVNKTISGNFNFTGYNDDVIPTITKEFTNGIFENIPYFTN